METTEIKKKSSLTRHEARELAFFFLFEKNFNDVELSEIIESAQLARDIVNDEYSVCIFNGVNKNLAEIDALIEKYSRKWKLSRLPKVSLAILRLAVFEMIYEKTPNAVCINEAVELTKTYATEKDASFVNGILSSINKELESTKDDKTLKEVEA